MAVVPFEVSRDIFNELIYYQIKSTYERRILEVIEQIHWLKYYHLLLIEKPVLVLMLMQHLVCKSKDNYYC